MEGKKFKEERLGGIACPHPPTGAWKEEGWGGWRRRARTGLLAGPRGAPGADAPERQARGVAPRGARARSWRPGPPGRAAARGAGSLTCRPLGCLLLPSWHRSSSLQSHFWRPSPEPPRAGARCLARLSGSPPPPARWLPGRHSASVPLSPQLLHRGPETPLSGWRARRGRPCRLV